MKNGRHDALDAYLDGDLPLEALPPELREEEASLRARVSELDRQVGAPAGLRQDVMRRIEALPRNRWQSLVDWFLRPRTLRFTPATASAVAAAGLAALLLLPALRTPGAPESGTPVAPLSGNAVATPAAMAPGASAGMVVTRFVFVAPDAESVALTGDWLGWDADEIALEELRGSGVWTVDVPVPPGVHEYSFVVDGTEWRPDPLAGSQTDDGFGRVNSVLMVSAAEA